MSTLKVNAAPILTRHIISHLRLLGNYKLHPECSLVGICSELTDKFNICGYKLVRKHSPSWPEYSGNRNYPVPIYSGIPFDNIWNGSYKQGKSRRRLCLFIAGCLEAELENKS